jgi:hypothetical protein
MLVLASLLSAATLAGPAPLFPFSWRCQVVSVGPPPLQDSLAVAPPTPPKPLVFKFSDGFNHASANGTGAWTETVEVSLKNLTAARAQYPNSYNSASFPGLVLHFSVTPADNLTTLECHWTAVQLGTQLGTSRTMTTAHHGRAQTQWTGSSTARLVGGGTMGVIVSTNNDANPVPVCSFADFNKVV